MTDERKADKVTFTIEDSATDYVVDIAGGTVKEETCELPGRLIQVTCYAEGELVAEYGRGDWIDEADTESVAHACELAGVMLEESESGETMRVPNDG